MALRPHSVGLSCAVLGALGFSIKAIFVKAAYRYGVDPETLLALRMLYALPLFLLLGAGAARTAPAALTAADWRDLALLGFLGYFASSYLDFLGLRHISAALERLILYVYPTIVVLYVAWRERRAAGKGAPDLGAASRTLAGEDRSAIWTLTGGAGGETAFPAGELRAPVYF